MIETNGSPVYMTGNDGFGLGGGLGGILAILIIGMMFMRFNRENGGDGNGTAAMLGAMAASNRDNGYRPQYATQQDVQFTSQFGQLLDGNRDIVDNVTRGTAQAVAATNQVYHDLADVVRDKYGELTRDIGGIRISQEQALANQNQCCCEQKMLIAETGAGINANIAQSRYESALNTAAIQKTITDEAQKNRDLFMRTRLEDVQNENNFLRTQNLLGNVVRYPTESTYIAGRSPFCGNGGGCGCGGLVS